MYRLLLIGLIVLAACAPQEVIYPSKDLTRLEIFHVEELKQRYDIRLDEASTYYNPGIGGLSLRYTSEELFDLCQARNLLVDLVDSLLGKINEDAYVASQLTYYPLDYLDIDLVLTFDSFFGQYVDEQYVNQIRMANGFVTFFAFNTFNNEGDLFEMHSEPYETTQANSYYLRRAMQQFATTQEIEDLAPMTPHVDEPFIPLGNPPSNETEIKVEFSTLVPPPYDAEIDVDEEPYPFYNGL